MAVSTGVFDANGNFDATGGVIDFSDDGYLKLGAASITSLGTLDEAAGIVSYDRAGDQTILTDYYYKLRTAGGGVKTLAAGTSYFAGDAGTGNLYVETGTTLAIGDQTLYKKAIGASNSYVYGTVTLNNGAWKPAYGGSSYLNTITEGGVITVTGTGTIYLNGGASFQELGDFFTHGTGTVVYGRNASQSIVNDDFYNLTIDGTSGTKTFSFDVDIENNMVVTSAVTLAIGSVTVAVGGQVTMGGTMTIAAGILDANGSFDATGGVIDFTDEGYLNLGGATITSLGTLDNAAGTVSYDRAGNQTVLLDNYYNLKIDGSGTKTLGGAIDIEGNILLSNATLDVSGSDYDILLAGDWINAGGVFSCESGSVTFDGEQIQKINVTTAGGTTPQDSDFTFYNVIIDANDVKLYYNQTNNRQVNMNDLQINDSKSFSVISN